MILFEALVLDEKGYIQYLLYQGICDADLLFINGIAMWSGSVHDSGILPVTALFRAFESPRYAPKERRGQVVKGSKLTK